MIAETQTDTVSQCWEWVTTVLSANKELLWYNEPDDCITLHLLHASGTYQLLLCITADLYSVYYLTSNVQTSLIGWIFDLKQPLVIIFLFHILDIFALNSALPAWQCERCRSDYLNWLSRVNFLSPSNLHHLSVSTDLVTSRSKDI